MGEAGRGHLGGGFSRLGLGADLRRQLLTDIEGEHRLVTVLFADLTSSVARTQDLHPEDAARLVNGLLETMVEILLRYGGRIDRFLGDGLLAVFGIPETHEDDPERAVRAALEIRERADELGLGITAGINTGRVYFGPVGSSLHEELTVMGAVVNLAARLQSVAREGQILISPATRARVYAAFDLRPISAELRGFEGRVDAYLTERLLDHPDKVRGLEDFRAKLVGRKKELETLEAASREGGGRLVALVGPAGVGKSRLAAEFHDRFVAGGGRWLEGRCTELTRQLGYGPIRDLLNSAFSPAAVGDVASESLKESVDTLITEGRLPRGWDQEAGPFLRALAGDQGMDPRVQQASPEQHKAMTAAAIGDFLEALAGDRPTVVFIEDLHWADELTTETFRALMSRLRGSPVLLMCSYRSEAGSPGVVLAHQVEADPSLALQTLTLGELCPGDMREMLESLLETTTLPGWMEGLILSRSEGNPLFLEELIRSLIQNGTLCREESGWKFDSAPGELEVPYSVQALVLSRVDRLDRQTRRCTQIASVLGRSFERSLLETLAGRNLQREMDVLTDAGIIHAERLHPSPVYTFSHALAQEAVYDTLLPSRRSELHGLVARTLEAESTAVVEVLAYHYERSRDHSKAVRYLLAAGERAMAAFVTDSALGYLKRGLSRTEELGDGEDQRQWASRFRARRGEMLERLARHEEARSELSLALELSSSDALEAARLHRLIGQTFRLMGRYGEADASYERAEGILDASPDRDSTPYHRAWIEIQKERAFALYFGGKAHELPEHNSRTGPVIEKHGSVPQRIDYLVGRLLSDFRRHRFAIPPQVVTNARNVFEMATAAADLGRVVELRFVLGFAFLWADQVEESEAWLGKAVSDARRIGDAMLECRAAAYHATCLRRLDRVAEAVEAAHTALTTAQALEDRHYEGHALSNLCWGKWRNGAEEDAKRLGFNAFEAWGTKEVEGGGGLETEFAFLAVWPMVAMALADDALDEARGYLRYLCSPQERALPPDLQAIVDDMVQGEPSREGLQQALRLSRRHRLA